MQESFTPGVTAPPIDRPARWYLYQGDRLIVDERSGAPAIPTAASVAALGARCGAHRVSRRAPRRHRRALLSPAWSLTARRCRRAFAAHDLRSLFEHFDDFEIGLAGRAKQIAHWERDHQFCGRCGSATEATTGRAGAALSRVRAEQLSTHCAGDHRGRHPPRHGRSRASCWRATTASPPGATASSQALSRRGETLEECVRREVAEETGVQVANIRYFGNQPWPFPNSLMIGFTAEYAGGELAFGDDEIADAQWFAPDALPLVPPKISIARKLIDDFVARHTQDAAPLHTW
jgi:NAD+ diphosphatase